MLKDITAYVVSGAVSVACLTIYDMCKAIDKGMTIESIGLDLKAGGKSGEWRRG